MTISGERVTTQPPVPFADLDWSAEQARSLGEGALDIWAEFLERLRDMPIRRPGATVEEVRARVARPVPDDPLPADELLAYLRELVFEHATLTGHPGFMAYISGSGTIPGAAADLIAAAINQNVGGWRLSPGATEIEQHLVRWFAARLGFPGSAGGIITSGGAMAAFVALKAARDAAAVWPIRELGVRAGAPMTLYASAEVHDVNHRAADMLGLGTQALRTIPVDDHLRMRTARLRKAIAEDRAQGFIPVAVVGTAGTVATGAIDPLEEIADVCAEERLWFHVDGAYGGVAALTDALRPLFAGIERADSVALDPHKWLYTPHSGGAIVVRDLSRLEQAFSLHPTYTREDKSVTHTGLDFYTLSPQFSRGFHALKIWVSLLAHGWRAYSARIAQDVRLARYLWERAQEEAELEPIGTATLSIACFRYVPVELRGSVAAEPYLDALNERLMNELQVEGVVFPSNAVVNGRYAIRACIVNFRTEAEHVDLLIDRALERGRTLDAELRPAELRAAALHG